jgi:hypothetical protein
MGINLTNKCLERRGLVAVRVSFALNLVLIGTKIAVVIRTGQFSTQTFCHFQYSLSMFKTYF